MKLEALESQSKANCVIICVCMSNALIVHFSLVTLLRPCQTRRGPNPLARKTSKRLVIVCCNPQVNMNILILLSPLSQLCPSEHLPFLDPVSSVRKPR